ncbi:hypothetical protein Cgig2_014273 [Carnegiea gigantea]|uniref:F-box associated beta-propeller type 1 domain-containing protein n=1 Tax=Carnegiea gigantea TaxID=171969 RepID=A0A9Q1JKE3_9CARY|nr:hypothetical protein Cgig2_014273 [Carnegiea gigantea]
MAVTLSLDDSNSMASGLLPIDIIASEILPRVSARSLLGFKCVCKFFKTLISSSEFINLHLRHSQSLSSDSNRLLILLKEPSLFSVHSKTVNVVGSCNGLLCLRIRFSGNADDSTPLVLLNPSTGIYRSIPPAWNRASLFVENLGFGYDSEANDYKIVQIIHECRRAVMVYSLKANSWRLVEKEASPQNYIATQVSSIGALIDDHLFHWMCRRGSDSKYRIRCFNLRTERWGNDVPVPDCQTTNNSKIDLGVLHGLLCLSIQYFRNGCMDLTFDVWIMKEYGVVESWTKLLSHYDDQTWMPNPIRRIFPLAYRRGSRSEVLMNQRGKLIWYNVTDKTARNAEIPGVRLPVDTYVCSGSLVGLDGALVLN